MTKKIREVRRETGPSKTLARSKATLSTTSSPTLTARNFKCFALKANFGNIAAVQTMTTQRHERQTFTLTVSFDNFSGMTTGNT